MKEKVTKILILILMIILIYMLVDIYASYKTRINEEASSQIEPWVIFVNDENIAAIETKTFEIDEIIDENPNVSSGKLAPGSNIKLPIKIDATRTKMIDIRYDIDIENLNINHPGLKIADIIEKNTNVNLIRTDKNRYTGIITKENIEKDIIHEIVVNIIWENDEDYNELDTVLGNSNANLSLKIPLSIQVSQYNGEEILEYKE